MYEVSFSRGIACLRRMGAAAEAGRAVLEEYLEEAESPLWTLFVVMISRPSAEAVSLERGLVGYLANGHNVPSRMRNAEEDGAVTSATE
jgi:hypothetical protein